MAATIISIVIVGLIFLVVAIFIDNRNRRVTRDLLNDMAERDKARQAASDQEYREKIYPVLKEYYDSLCTAMCKPSNTSTVNLLRADTEEDILYMQAMLPHEWWNWSDVCDCWCDDEKLNILQSFDTLEQLIKNNTSAYNSDYKIKQAVRHFVIPLKDIQGCTLKGEIHHSEKTVIPAQTTYTGATVNGIGFGELKTRPAVTVPQVTNTQYVALSFYENNSNNLRTLFFNSDSLNPLIQSIPQLKI